MEQILEETIVMYNQYIENVVIGCQTIVQNIRADRTFEGFQQVIDFTEGIQWLQQVNELLKRNQIAGFLDIEIINAELIEINSALEKQDYVLLADIFEYEIEPFFSNYIAIEV